MPVKELKVLLFVVLVVLVLFTLINISDVVSPLFSWTKSALFEENINIIQEYNVLLLLKSLLVITSLYFIFVIYSILSALFAYDLHITNKNSIYHKYQLEDLIFRALSWNISRIFHILRPILLVGVIGLSLFLISIIFINLFFYIAGISLSLVTFSATFIGLSLLFGLMTAIIMIFWNFFTSSFGMEIIVSEPELSNAAVKKRSRKLVFIRPENILAYILYLFSIAALFAQAINIVLTGISVNTENAVWILPVVIFDILLFITLKSLKFSLYNDSLSLQCARLKAISDTIT